MSAVRAPTLYDITAHDEWRLARQRLKHWRERLEMWATDFGTTGDAFALEKMKEAARMVAVAKADVLAARDRACR